MGSIPCYITYNSYFREISDRVDE
nr:envelope membrane protein [Iris ensata]